jgi:hypothetical protein
MVKKSRLIYTLFVWGNSRNTIFHTAVALHAAATNRIVELLSSTASVISGVRVQARLQVVEANQVTFAQRFFFFPLLSAPRFPLLCVFSLLCSAST